MLQRILLSISLALLLTLSQQGAMLHEISHYSNAEQLVTESAVSINLDHNQDQAPHSPICDKCLGFAGIGHSISSGYFAAPIVANHFIATYTSHTSYDSRQLLPYAARAPPSLS